MAKARRVTYSKTQFEVARRAHSLGITGVPANAVNFLGQVRDGNVLRPAYLLHAMDAVITDGTWVLLVERGTEPGKGKLALLGGKIKPNEIGADGAIRCILRETGEEAGLNLGHQYAIKMVGNRRSYRPFELRVADREVAAEYKIPEGSLYTLSTQLVRIDVPDLKQKSFNAGSDAAAVELVKLSRLKKDFFAVADHPYMLMDAVPEYWDGGKRRWTTITLASAAATALAYVVDSNGATAFLSFAAMVVCASVRLQYEEGKDHTLIPPRL